MPQAIVLANLESRKEVDVIRDVKKLDGINLCFSNYGVYDMAIFMRADTMDKLKETISWRIRRLDGVEQTLTMIVVENEQTPNIPLPQGFKIDKPTALVLLNIEIGSEANVLSNLKDVEGVIAAFAVYGVYDIVIVVQGETLDVVKDIVTLRVRKLNKVRSTLTMIPTEFKS
jgi:DNA-binding Lrp family transcriptional regulator